MNHDDASQQAKLLDVTTGQIINLTGNEVFLGRSRENDVVVRDLSVSRRHARIYFENGRYYMEDLSSANGSLLNGVVMNSRVVLWANDRIHLGRSEFVFMAKNAETPARDVAFPQYGTCSQPAPQTTRLRNVYDKVTRILGWSPVGHKA